MSTILFSGNYLKLIALDDSIGELCLDNSNAPVNTLSVAFREDLDLAIEKIKTAQFSGLLLSSAKPGFLAGANIDDLEALLKQSPEQQIAFCRQTALSLCALEDLPCPIVAAVNGFALGGGMEFALCADYRVAGEKALLGFPEVSLGVLPGVGGTVKSARLAGFATALEWLCGGRQYPAPAALAAGMIDAIAAETLLRDEALSLLKQAVNGSLDWQTRRQQRQGTVAIDSNALAQTQAKYQASPSPAAIQICQLVADCAPLNRDEALIAEAQQFSALAQSSTAKALVAVYQAQQSLRKKNKAFANNEKIQRAGVLGAGIMGGGIAYTTALRGTPVIMKDIQQSALDLGTKEASKLLSRQVSQQRLPQAKADTILSAIQTQLDYREFDSLDIIVEAVIENLNVKQSVLSEVAEQCSADTVLASNTSSLRIADIAAGLKNPAQLVGMHFFNPVHMMPLVEVIKGPQSSDLAIAKTIALALQMGKTPLLVKDCSGFLINRILGAYFAAFLHLIHEGVDFRRIDRLMEAWGWPMGPAYLLDVAGIDTLDKAMRILGDAYPGVMSTNFTSAIALLAENGRYGQKTGSGFYQYTADTKGRPVRSEDPVALELLASIQNGKAQISDEEIEQRMILAVILEASRCLNEGICESAEDIDTGMRLATGFPAHRCGPLWSADNIGLSQILADCEKYAHIDQLYTADAGLLARATTDKGFYS